MASNSEGTDRKQMAAADMLDRANRIAERCADAAAESDQAGAFPEREFQWIREAGLLAAPLPRQYGGAGLGTEEGRTKALLHLLKHLGRGNLSVGRLYEGHVNALLLIHQYGTAEQEERYAGDVHDGHLFGVWNTEGSDGVSFTSQKNGRFRLEGAKIFASGAGHVTRPLITGHLPGSGWQMAIVCEAKQATRVDKSWWHPVGMRASASYKIDFAGVELSEGALVGPGGAYRQEPWFSGGAIRFAAVQMGGAEALVDVMRTHLRELDRTEAPHQQSRAGRAAIAVESGKGWLNRAAEMKDALLDGASSEEKAARLVAYANMTRTAVERICLDLLEYAERSVGARGMLKPHPLERLARDLRVYLRQPAPDEALDAVGRYVLDASGPIHELWKNGT